MNEAEARTILIHLSEGRAPDSDKPLAMDGVWNHPDVVRALAIAARRLKNSQRDRPARHGTAWTEEEDRLLLDGFDAGTTQADLAREHKRSSGSVRSRLILHGRIEGKTRFTQDSRPQPAG